jgi:hypothetical protein
MVWLANMRRAAGPTPDPNDQGGGQRPFCVHGPTQTNQNRRDLKPKCIGPLEML